MMGVYPGTQINCTDSDSRLDENRWRVDRVVDRGDFEQHMAKVMHLLNRS